jgi:hypothetical protein
MAKRKIHVSFEGNPIMFCGFDLSKSKKHWSDEDAITTTEQLDRCCGNCARTKLFKKLENTFICIV